MTSVANGKEELNVQPLSHQSVLSPVVEPAGTICCTLNRLERFFTSPLILSERSVLLQRREETRCCRQWLGKRMVSNQEGSLCLFRVNGGSSTSGCKMPFSLFWMQWINVTCLCLSLHMLFFCVLEWFGHLSIGVGSEMLSDQEDLFNTRIWSQQRFIHQYFTSRKFPASHLVFHPVCLICSVFHASTSALQPSESRFESVGGSFSAGGWWLCGKSFTSSTDSVLVPSLCLSPLFCRVFHVCAAAVVFFHSVVIIWVIDISHLDDPQHFALRLMTLLIEHPSQYLILAGWSWVLDPAQTTETVSLGLNAWLTCGCWSVGLL